VEFALCKEDMDKINELVKLGEDTYDWSSPGKNRKSCIEKYKFLVTDIL